MKPNYCQMYCKKWDERKGCEVFSELVNNCAASSLKNCTITFVETFSSDGRRKTRTLPHLTRALYHSHITNDDDINLFRLSAGIAK